jgi:glycerophosphoryl diester phosphodiesterase
MFILRLVSLAQDDGFYQSRIVNMKPFLARLLILIVLVVAILSHGGCESDLSLTIPQFSSASQLTGGIPLAQTVKRNIAGVYSVESEKNAFGSSVVLHWNGDVLSVFCERNVAYAVMSGVVKDSTCFFEGYWRYAQSSETGLIRFSILPEEGARELLRGGQPSAMTIRGLMGDGQDEPSRPVVLRYARPLRMNTEEFLVVGHRGGGRNSDRLPFSENSLSLLKFAGKIGCNGVEIDVRLTRDGVPILFHDDEFSTRLIKGDYMIGPVANYRFEQIRSYCRLINGELIPTLEEALDVIVSQTNLRFVWLDIKTPLALDSVIALQKRFLVLAAQLNRKLEIVVGLPDEQIIKAFLSRPDAAMVPALCESSVDDVRRTNALYWGPRWTLGTLNGEVAQLHAEHRKAVTWTMDVPAFIQRYLTDGDFDGMVTNYPTLLAYYLYSRE